MPVSLEAVTVPASAETLQLSAVYDDYASFVWATLHRCGIAPSDLDDALQEVFLVVHRRLSTYRGDGLLTAWLYGICVRVANNHRRRAHVRRERPTDVVPEDPTATLVRDPEQEASQVQLRERLQTIMNDMDCDRRALMVMYEVDELSCEEIASFLNIPIGTVHSRLHAARKDFQRALARWSARTGEVLR